MREVGPGIANDLRDRFAFTAHGFCIQNDLEFGRRQSFCEFYRLSSSIDEICFRGCQRLETNGHLALLGSFDCIAKTICGPIQSLITQNPGQQVSLFWRADNHYLAAQVGTEIYQAAKIIGGALTNR